MKNFFIKIRVVYLLVLCLNINNLKAQTTFNLDSVISFDWDFNDTLLCSPPYITSFILHGSSTGYNPSDDVVYVKIWYGDGGYYEHNGGAYEMGNIDEIWTPTYTYMQSGNYTVKILIEASADGKKDSLILPNLIVLPDTCANISGTFYIDQNNNCTLDTSENFSSSDIQVLLKRDGDVIAGTSLDSNGMYFFNVAFDNTYTIFFYNYNNFYDLSCPLSTEQTIYLTSAGSFNNDFAISCTSGFDLDGYYTVLGIIPGQIRSAEIFAFNHSCDTINSEIRFVLDPRSTYLSMNLGIAPSAILPSITGDTLVWYKPLSNYSKTWQNSLYPRLYFDTTLVVGDTLCFTLLISPTSGDTNPLNNIFYECYEAVASYDPNMKYVSPKGEGLAGNILKNQRMTYTIDFQNTGTHLAYNIFIIDTISSNLDLSTISVAAASHDFSFHVYENNVVKFRFDNILLPDSNSNESLSHGFVHYSINQQPELLMGTEIKNTAHIYFDYNEPVVTNTTLNTIQEPTSIQEKSNRDVFNFFIYPNPSSNNLFIEFTLKEVDYTSIFVSNILGTQLSTIIKNQLLIGNQKIKLDLNEYKSGLYFLTIQTKNQTIVKKFIIKK